MKKILKLCAVTTAMLAALAGVQSMAFAAVDTSAEESVVSHAESQLNAVANENPEIAPYEDNQVPNTGVVSMAIPGVTAVLAAVTAAAALTGKKK